MSIPQKPLRSTTPEPPYSWESKSARRLIRNVLNAEDRWAEIPSRLSLYAALCEESSNKKGAASFYISQKILGDMAGLSPRSVGPATQDLIRIGVIFAEDPPHGGRGMKTYQLLSIPSEAASERSATGHSRPSLPTTEESREKQREEKEKASFSIKAIHANIPANIHANGRSGKKSPYAFEIPEHARS
ncbi:MAG: hypothetical protein ABI443_04965 [Chthoniobacterales bacterium]